MLATSELDFWTLAWFLQRGSLYITIQNLGSDLAIFLFIFLNTFLKTFKES